MIYHVCGGIVRRIFAPIAPAGRPSGTAFLDGARAIAALMVVAHHLSGSNMLNFGAFDFRGLGAAGVSIFFVLSAYLLSRLIIVRNDNIFSVTWIEQYAWRRITRIYPLFLFYVSLAFVSSILMVELFGQERGIPFFVTGRDYVDHLFLQEGFGVTWTLVVEFQYYIVLPVATFLFVVAARRAPLLAAPAMGLTLAAALWLRWETPGGPGDLGLANYLVIFLLGSWIGVLDGLRERDGWTLGLSARTCRILLGALGIAALAALAATTGPGWRALFGGLERPGLLADARVAPALFFAVFVFAVRFGAGWVGAPFAARPLRYVGAISFSLYLNHMIVISMLGVFGAGAFPTAAWLPAVALSLMASHATYQLIERPGTSLSLPWRIGRARPMREAD